MSCGTIAQPVLLQIRRYLIVPTIEDRADYKSPNAPSAGISLVLANGRTAWKNETLAGSGHGIIFQHKQSSNATESASPAFFLGQRAFHNFQQLVFFVYVGRYLNPTISGKYYFMQITHCVF